MLSRRARLSVVVVLVLWAEAAALRAQQAPAAHPGALEVNGIGSGLVPLDGAWQFHLGDDPAWASPALDDSTWESINVDQPWGAQTHYGYTGRAWYRRHIDFHVAPGTDPDIALYMPITRDACEVYWNGRLVGGFGKLPPHAVWYYDSVWPFSLGLGKATSGVLAIRVWKAPYDVFSDPHSGGLEGPPMAGNPEAVANAKTVDDYQWLHTGELGNGFYFLYALIAVLSFVAWLRDRRNRILGWMAIFGAGLFFSFLLDNVPLLLPYRFDYPLLFLAFSATGIALWYLLLELLGLDRHPRLRRITFVLAAVSAGCIVLECILQLFNWETGPTRLLQALDYLATIVANAVDLYPLFLVPFAFRKRLGVARSVLAIVAMANQIVMVTPSILSMGIRYTHLYALNDALEFKIHVGGSDLGNQDIANAALFITIAYAMVAYLDLNRTRQQELETEFRSARELQQFLIPASLPLVPGFTVTSAYLPAREVGGDFFQIIPLGVDATLIALGDVSGKGLKAAMAVSVIVGALRALASSQSHPGQLLGEMNRRLQGSLGGAFATCAVLRIGADGSCVLASAGHPPPLVNGRELPASSALPLGIAAEEAYEEIRFELDPGDCLALYTDGLLEARSVSGELFGFGRIQSLFAGQPTAAEAARAAVDFGQEDDVTVLTLARTGYAEEPEIVRGVSAEEPAI